MTLESARSGAELRSRVRLGLPGDTGCGKRRASGASGGRRAARDVPAPRRLGSSSPTRARGAAGLGVRGAGVLSRVGPRLVSRRF